MSNNIDYTFNADTTQVIYSLKKMEQATTEATKKMHDGVKKSTSSLSDMTAATNKATLGWRQLRSQVAQIATSLIALSGIAWKIAGDYDESLNKVRVVFGAAAKDVEYFAKTTMRMQGIAEATSLEMLGLYGDMATSMGIAQERAAALSQQMVALVGDVASLKNLPIKQVETAFQAIFTGEARAMRRLGVIMTVDAMEHWMKAIGETGKYMEKSLAEKVELRMKYVNQALRYSIGDFNRTFETTVNQMRYFREQWITLGEQFGHILMKTLTPLLISLNRFLENIRESSNATKEWIVRIAGAITVLSGLLFVAGILVPVFRNMWTVILLVGDAFKWLGGVWKDAIKYLKSLQVVITNAIVKYIDLMLAAKTAGAAMKAMFAASFIIASVFAAGIAALGLAIWGVVSAYKAMNKEIDISKKVQENLNESGKRGSEVYERQKQHLQDLITLMRMADKEKKKELLRRVQTGFPDVYNEVVGNTTITNSNIDEIINKLEKIGLANLDLKRQRQSLLSQYKEAVEEITKLGEKQDQLNLSYNKTLQIEEKQRKIAKAWNNLWGSSSKKIAKEQQDINIEIIKYGESLREIELQWISLGGVLQDLKDQGIFKFEEPGPGVIQALKESIQAKQAEIDAAQTAGDVVAPVTGNKTKGWITLTEELGVLQKQLKEIEDKQDLILNPPSEKVSRLFREIEQRAKTAGESYNVATEKIKGLYQLAEEYEGKGQTTAAGYVRGFVPGLRGKEAEEMLNEYQRQLSAVDARFQEQINEGVTVSPLDSLKEKLKIARDELNKFTKGANNNSEAIEKLRYDIANFTKQIENQKIKDFTADINAQVQQATELANVYTKLGREYDLYGQLIDIYTNALENSRKVVGITTQELQGYYEAIKLLEDASFQKAFKTSIQDIENQAKAMSILGISYNKNTELMGLYEQQMNNINSNYTGLTAAIKSAALYDLYFEASQKSLQEQVQEGLVAIQAQADTAKLLGERFDVAGAQLSMMTSLIEAATAKWGAQSEQVKILNGLLEEMGLIQERNAMTFQTTFEDIGRSLADMLAQGDATVNGMIKQALKMAWAWLVEKIMVSVPFPANIAVAMGAGALMGTIQNQIPEFKDGGIVNGPTLGIMGEYPGAKSNPEIIAPLDKLQKYINGNGKTTEVYVHGQLAGDTIYLTNERFSRKKALVQ